MDFNGSQYNYIKSFAASGTHKYNITCSSANFVTLEAKYLEKISLVKCMEGTRIYCYANQQIEGKPSCLWHFN